MWGTFWIVTLNIRIIHSDDGSENILDKSCRELRCVGPVGRGFTCDSQHVLAFAPNCTLLKVHTEGVNSSQYLNLIFVLVVFFSLITLPNFSISRLCGFVYYYQKLSSMVGLSNERKISVRTSDN